MTRLRDPLAYLQPAKDGIEYGETPLFAPACPTCGVRSWSDRCWTCEPDPTPCVVCGEESCDLVPEPNAVPPW